MEQQRLANENHAVAELGFPILQKRHATVRAAWFTLAIDIYRAYERALDAATTDRKRVSAVRRLKAARPAIQHMLRDADLGDEDRAYLIRLLTRIERYFVHIPQDLAAA
jgi:hypothetical protein